MKFLIYQQCSETRNWPLLCKIIEMVILFGLGTDLQGLRDRGMEISLFGTLWRCKHPAILTSFTRNRYGVEHDKISSPSKKKQKQKDSNHNNRPNTGTPSCEDDDVPQMSPRTDTKSKNTNQPKKSKHKQTKEPKKAKQTKSKKKTKQRKQTKGKNKNKQPRSPQLSATKTIRIGKLLVIPKENWKYNGVTQPVVPIHYMMFRIFQHIRAKFLDPRGCIRAQEMPYYSLWHIHQNRKNCGWCAVCHFEDREGWFSRQGPGGVIEHWAKHHEEIQYVHLIIIVSL